MRLIPLVCAALLWHVAGLTAQAFCICPCPIPCCIVVCEMRPVVAYRPEWREEKVPCVVRKVNMQRYVSQERIKVWVPKEVEENARTTVYTPIPRLVERDVPRRIWVPLMLCDPCAGCYRFCYFPQWINERVRVMECEYRKEEKDVPVKVWRVVQEDRVVDRIHYLPQIIDQQTWTVHRYCVWIPYETTVCVPTFMPYVR